MSDKTQKQEMQDAKKENRIPKCISCNHDLKTILIRQGKQAESEIDEEVDKWYNKNLNDLTNLADSYEIKATRAYNEAIEIYNSL